MIELAPVVAIVAAVYVFSRVVGYAEQTYKEESERKKEEERKKKIAELYGR